jgi:hypothetical protein
MGGGRRELGGGRRKKGEGRREKGEGRREKGDGRREKEEGRKEKRREKGGGKRRENAEGRREEGGRRRDSPLSQFPSSVHDVLLRRSGQHGHQTIRGGLAQGTNKKSALERKEVSLEMFSGGYLVTQFLAILIVT